MREMTYVKVIAALSLAVSLGACGGDTLGKQNKTRDRGIDSKDISQLVAGVWVDPDGCDHWIIDDGLEGYLSQRLDKYGKPVCSGVASPRTATGPFKGGLIKGDAI